jgi:hypothetical protein
MHTYGHLMAPFMVAYTPAEPGATTSRAMVGGERRLGV